MPHESGFRCRSCDHWHDGPPLAFAWDAPAYWSDGLSAEPDNVLEPEICVIKGQGFFVRGLIEIPIFDSAEIFTWNVWVSLSKDNFVRSLEMWDKPGRETQPPYFGWLSTDIPIYPLPTLNLKTNLHTRALGERPAIELEATDHPLAVEQREGITWPRVQEIAELLLHND